MNGPFPIRELRARAFQLVAAGAWSDVRALLAENAPLVREQPECATLLAEAFLRTGGAKEGRAWLMDVLPAMERSDDRASLRKATVLAGAAHFELGELDDARRAFASALELARADADAALVARAMNNLALIANIQGDWTEALALYNVALSAHQREGNVRGLAECYHNMAITFRDLGRFDEADELEQRSVEFARDSEHYRLLPIARLGRAELALRRGDPLLAEAAARRVAQDFAAAGDPVSEADALRLAGVACTATGKLDEARALLDFALERTRQHGAVLNEAETLRARAELLAASGAPVAALEDARAALGLFGRLHAHAAATALLRWMEALPLDS